MTLERKPLIVVDPSSNSQPTVDRVAQMAQTDIPDYQGVTVLVAVDQSSADTGASNEAIYRDGNWLRSIAERLESAGVKPEVRISWSREWADSILYTASAVSATAVIVPHPGGDDDQEFSDEFWYLIRNSPVPVGIIRAHSDSHRKTIMIAMDLQDKSISELNKRLIDAGKLAASHYNAELHLASAYGSSERYPDRAKIIADTGIANDNIHLVAGGPDDLTEVSQRLDPDLIMIGATRRTGIRAALRGRKMTKILRSLKQDIFVIV